MLCVCVFVCMHVIMQIYARLLLTLSSLWGVCFDETLLRLHCRIVSAEAFFLASATLVQAGNFTF